MFALIFQQPATMNNKLFRRLINWHYRNKNVTWVDRLVRATVNITEQDLVTLRKYESTTLNEGKTHLTRNSLNSSSTAASGQKFKKSPGNDNYDSLSRNSENLIGKTIEMQLEFLISLFISIKEKEASFPLIIELLKDFEKREPADMPQVIIISKYLRNCLLIT